MYMKHLAKILLCMLSCLSLSYIYASAITVTLVQNEKAPSTAVVMTQFLEETLLNSLFEQGHIVSNTEIRFDGSKFNDLNFGLKEASFGMSDYLITVLLQYSNEEKKDVNNNSAYAQLQGIQWKITSVASQKVLFSNIFDISKIVKTETDPYQQAKKIGIELSNESNSFIKNHKK